MFAGWVVHHTARVLPEAGESAANGRPQRASCVRVHWESAVRGQVRPCRRHGPGPGAGSSGGASGDADRSPGTHSRESSRCGDRTHDRLDAENAARAAQGAQQRERETGRDLSGVAGGPPAVRSSPGSTDRTTNALPARSPGARGALPDPCGENDFPTPSPSSHHSPNVAGQPFVLSDHIPSGPIGQSSSGTANP